MDYYNQLLKFIEQANSDNLRTSEYDKQYHGTSVKVSFGQGNPAHVPWISFLKPPNVTSNGIYPVYLLFKEQGILILAYGVSETNKPLQNWELQNKEKVKDYFINKYDVFKYRYGESFIYKIYNVKKLPEKNIVNSDLNNIIDEYHAINFEILKTELFIKTNSELNSDVATITLDITLSGLRFPPILITRFIASLLAKPFVILTGLSGSGKTKLAQAFANWICQNDDQYRIVPVGADWTNREPLLGYPNALNAEEYVKPDSGVLDLLIRAIKNPHLPYFLILDEMNLSHVERYFADFLSAMESKEEISLHSIEDGLGDVPNKFRMPKNVFIIGTVNIDETTNMFSPKVLDRANTIEFRVTESEMSGFLHDVKGVDLEVLKGKGASIASSFVATANNPVVLVDVGGINTSLLTFFGELKKVGAEFGYRTAFEIHKLIHHLGVLDPSMTPDEKIDVAVIQKLLPKLHGSRKKMCPVLETLGCLCMTGMDKTKISANVFSNHDFDFNQDSVLYPLSLEKIARMYRGAIDNGFTSFAEA
jgi:5-methylcytosine-specific restriction protein B